MNKLAEYRAESEQYRCRVVKTSKPSLEAEKEILEGLLSSPRWISCKYLYDEKGSMLFDQICDTSEYYPTRTEAALLSASAAEIISLSKPENIIELGSGTSRKTRYLLDECEAQGISPTYWPFDVCEPVIHDAALQLIKDYPWLQVEGLVGDYLAGLEHFPKISGSKVYVYLGGTIGNFDNAQAIVFLQELKIIMNASDCLLVGFDRVKAVELLNAAYNDAGGLTAEFNLNILKVANERLGANFAVNKFEHLAFYNEEKAQIEMHLVATEEMQVSLTTQTEPITFLQGERIFTEVSRKFTEQSIKALLSSAGFTIEKHFEAEGARFSLVLCRPS